MIEKNCTATSVDALKMQCYALNSKLSETNHKLNHKKGELDLITYYLNSLLNHMSQGLLFINIDGYIITCNPAAEALLNIKTQDILFHQFADHFADNLFGFSVKQAIDKCEAPPNSLRLVTLPSGKNLELEVNASLIVPTKETEVEGLNGLLILLRDMTQFHHLQEMANRHDRLKALGEMAAMLAHEIRNPLGSIKGFASLLARDLHEHPALFRMAQDIETGADNLNRLVTNVLNYSRPLQLSLVATDLIEVVRDLCRHIEADASLSPKIRLDFHSSLATLEAPIDVMLAKSALLNIIANAIQAMPNGGTISISVECDTDFALVRIKDTGEGISPENLKKLFQPFFTTKAKGNGFGLAEVHRVVQAHAGKVEVQSKLEQGTTFIVSLPLKPLIAPI